MAGERRGWRGHIARQLKHRDRVQKGRFQTIVQAYNKLLEKSSWDNFAAELQAKSLDGPMGLLPPRSTEEISGCALDGCMDTTEAVLSLKRSHAGQRLRIESINGELAYKIYERNMLLRAKADTLEEQKGRLVYLEGELSSLVATRDQLRGQVSDLDLRNVNLKEKYDALQRRYWRGEDAFRQAAEKGAELLRGLMQGKVDAAEHENKRIERAKHARVCKELKKATRARLSVKVERDVAKADQAKMDNRDLLDEQNGERSKKRPFRSASATSMTLARYVDVFKGLFDFRLKRGNSVSNVSEDHYCRIPCCAAACLPSHVSDIQEAHGSEVNAVRFSPNSGMLATGGTDRLIQLWNVVGGRLEKMQTLEGANGSITSVEFDPSGCHLLAATYNNAAQLWKTGDCQCKEILTGHTDKVTAAKFRSTQHQAVTGSRDRTVKEWDLSKGACSRTIDVFSYCNDVVCCGTIIVSGHHDKTIRFWDSRDVRCTQVIPVEGTVTSLSISPDQMHLLSCSRDNALKVIDLRMHNVRQVLRADGFKCGSDGTKAVFSPDKSYAMVGSTNGSLFIWNMGTGKLETTLAGAHWSPVNAVAWSSSGTYVGSVDRCKKVVLWR
ncbi:protein Atg16l2 isoform X2 [Anolis carolinensis]|uniref:protein Atg16l2 isoform X2 n=1 Tax=Anolis carolinensis TaxID=28377 RepID=UPI002F2B7012